jgi:MoxR-like ATPase
MSARDEVLALKQRMARSIIGQESMVERLILGLLANGNLLVEGLPGLAKTRAIKSLAKCLDAKLSRIQFTPDLLPSDVTGSEVYFTEGGKGEFRFQEGPVFERVLFAREARASTWQGRELHAALSSARKKAHSRPLHRTSRDSLPALNPW